MSKKRRLHIIVSIVLMFGITISASVNVFAQSIDDLMIMTEIYPPLNFEQDGKLQGISVDIMALLLERLNTKLTRDDIKLLPWARAYKYLQTRENTCLFSTTRTEEREDLFKWVGPIIPSRHVLIAPKYKKISIQSLEDLKKYRIGTVIEDVAEQLLVEMGYDKGTLIAVSDPALCAKQLDKGRIDLWAYGDIVANWIIKQEGFLPDDYESVYVLKESGYYFAFYKETPDDVIQQFQQALDELNEQGEIQKIVDSYLK